MRWGTSHNVTSGRILLGLLFDERENRFTPTHASKKGHRYSYYTLKSGDKDSTIRLPALEFEQLVVGRIRDLLSKPLELAAKFPDLAVKDIVFDGCADGNRIDSKWKTLVASRASAESVVFHRDR